MSSGKFILITLVVAAAVFVAAQLVSNNYLFFAGYVVLQFVVLATAWNILGGYCGYVNFGSAAFFAVGAYSSVFMHKTYQLPLPLLILLAGAVAGFVGLGMGYLTLRLRGSFFAIATLALAVVLQTLVVNWDFVGGSRGAYVIRPNTLDLFGMQIPYIEYLFALMLTLAVVAIVAARTIEHSRLGYGFATIRVKPQLKHSLTRPGTPTGGWPTCPASKRRVPTLGQLGQKGDPRAQLFGRTFGSGSSS